MPIYSVQGPDGRIYDVEGPAGASNDQVVAAVKRQIASQQPAAQPEGGFVPAAKAGLASLKSDIAALAGRTGIVDEAAAEKYIKEQEEYKKRTFAPTQEGWTEAPVTKVKELLGGSLPYMAAPLAAGASAFALPEAAALGAAGLASAAQFTGSNLSRQLEEGKEEGKKLSDTNLTAAALAALPQAALDTISFKMIPGIRQVFSQAGKDLSPKAAAEIAKQGTAQVLKDYTLATGKAMGTEGLTEAGQQFFERLQAGLSLTDEKARDEYWDSLVGGAVLGGTLAPAGRYMERGAERSKQETARLGEAQKAREAEAVRQAAEAERRKTPEYAQEFVQKYDDLFQQFKSIEAKKPGKDASFEDREIYSENKAKKAELGKQLASMTGEYRRLKPGVAEAAAQAEAARMGDIEAQAAAQPQAAQTLPYFQEPQQTLPGMEAAPAIAPTEDKDIEAARHAKALDFAQKQQELEKLIEDHQQRESDAAAKGDIAAIKDLRGQRTMLRNEYDYVSKQLDLLGGYKPAGMEATNAAARAEALAKDIEAQRKKLQNMAGSGYDPDKADKLIAKIDKLEQERAGLQETAKAGVQTAFNKYEMETRPLAGAETKPQYAARVYQPGAAEIEAQEAAAREEAQRAEKEAAAEAERQRKVSPETAALKRIQERPAGAESMTLPAVEQAQPDLFGSPAMGRMQQELRGKALGAEGELLYTAEEEAKRPVQKAPGTGEFALRPERGAAAPDAKDIATRLASALAREDLPPGTRALLSRAERVLPRTDETGMLTMLDRELKAIEKYRPGAPVRRELLQGFPVGEVPVQKRVTAAPERPILRGPSIKLPALQNPAELAKLIAAQERGGAEAQAKQTALFPEEEKKLGYVKPDRAAFERFMRSPFVNTLRKALRADREILDRAKTLPELQARIAELQAKASEMEQTRLEYSQAARTIQLEKDVGKQRRDIAEIRGTMTKRIVERMELGGRLDEAKLLRNQLLEEGRKLGENVEPPFLAELNSVDEQLQTLQAELNTLNGALATLEGQARAETAKITLAKLNPKVATKEELAKAKQDLLDAQRKAGVIAKAAGEVRRKQVEAAAKQRRADEAVSRAEKDKQRTAEYNARQKELEAMYGESVQGEQYDMLTEVQRMAREMGEAKYTIAEEKAIQGNPNKVLGGYRSAIKVIEKRLENARQVSLDAKLTETQALQKTRDALNAAYKATSNAEARAALLPRLEAAEKAYDDAVDKLTSEPITWVGMKKDMQELANFYNKEARLEERIKAGEVAMPEERAPREAIKKLSKEQRAKQAAALREEAEKRRAAPGPATSGEALLPSEAKKAAKSKKTTYSSKGVGPEDTEGTKFIEDNIARKQALGKELNVFEEAFLRKQGKLNQTNLETSAEPLSKGAIAELERGNVVTALDDVSRTSKLGLNRQIAQRLKKLLGETKVTIVDDLKTEEGERAFGQATSDGLQIFLDRETGLNEETLLHEAVHAATESIISKPENELAPEQLAAKKELTALYNAIKNDPSITSAGAKQSLSEFVAEAMSNRLLQVQLANKKWTLQNAWNSFKKILLNMLGIKTPDNMLNVALAATDTLFEAPVRMAEPSTRLLNQKAVYANPEMARVGEDTEKFVAKQKTWWDKVKANATGLAFETQLVDRFAGFERLAKYMDALKGTQMLYYLRMYDQRMNFVSQSVSEGAPVIQEKTRADGRTERVIESKESANIKNVVNILNEAKPFVGNGEAINRIFTMYMAAIRAANKGLASLNFSEEVSQEMLDNVMKTVDGNPKLKEIFDRARNEYNAYNKDLLNFVASTGALSQEQVDNLTKQNDYIPFYREQNGVAELIIGNEAPIRIGSVAEQPYLHELIGGDKPILDFMTSSVQNTNMLMDMGLRNLATKNAVYELAALKAAKFVKKAQGPDVVKFKVDGEDRYAVVATETVTIGDQKFDTGVPADILVKGMEGIPTQMPALFRLMSVPSQLLRKAVTLSPLYMGKQLFRDSLAAPILTGANFTPVLGALREINKPTQQILERRGITGGQQFTGTSADLSKILRDITDGKPGWMKALGKFEAMGMEADALTRRAQYNSYIEQGLSEMEATLLSLESMNFNKRGASPSVHWANSMIPFFNAQIQGLNVLYKAMGGKLPFNEKLRIQEKLLQRGALMAGATLMYAAMMEDDDSYKNATPDQKYGNWFVRVPGFDEPVRVPVPFEIGYIFKALPEALYNSMTTKHGGEEAVQAFKQILLQTVPGGTSYGIPQALKPAIEAGLGKSFYTGRDILSAREKDLLPEEQFRANTSEVAKALGRNLNISPVIFEQLVNGYTGTMGLAFLQAVSTAVPTKESPEKAVKRLSEYPIVGNAFQPNDAGGIINSVYDRMQTAIEVKRSFDKMVNEGRLAEAKDLLQRRGDDYMMAEAANQFKTEMTKVTAAERAVQASAMPAEQKRKELDNLRKLKIAIANTMRDVSDKVVKLSSSF